MEKPVQKPFSLDAGSAQKTIEPKPQKEEGEQPVLKFILLDTGEIHTHVDVSYQPGTIFDIHI